MRVTKRGVPKGYTRGAGGKVLWRSEEGPQTPLYYVVQMDADGPEGRPIVFLPDEIEAVN